MNHTKTYSDRVARGAGFDPAIGNDPYNIRTLLRAEPDHVLRSLAAKKGDYRAREAARVLAARIGRRRRLEREAYDAAPVVARGRAARNRKAYFGRA